MKKLALLTALVLSPPIISVAQAASVTLFGSVDTGVKVEKSPRKAASVSMGDGMLAENGWGMYGVEELGGNFAVNFYLDQGFNLSDGTLQAGGRAFNHQSTLGLTSDYGELAFGRIGALSSTLGTFTMLPDTAMSTSFSPKGNNSSVLLLTNRYDNSVVYVLDRQNVKVSLMYSNGLNPDGEAEKDSNKWSRNSHYYGLGANYGAGPLNLTAIGEILDHKAEPNPLTTSIITVGASYDFLACELLAMYQFANDAESIMNYLPVKDFIGSQNALNKGARQHAVVLSLTAPMAYGTAGLQANYANGKFRDDFEGKDSYSVLSFGLKYVHKISKRTAFYSSALYGATYGALRAAAANSIRGYALVAGMKQSF